MCEICGGKIFLCLLFLRLSCLPLVYCQDALQAEGQEAWYLISETELQSIGRYKEKSDLEKQNWLLQAQKLKQDSADLNNQLAQVREWNRRLEQLFNKSETDRLTHLSLKNGEIADLKQEIADKTLEAEKWKGKAALLLAVIIALAAVIAVIIVIRITRII